MFFSKDEDKYLNEENATQQLDMDDYQQSTTAEETSADEGFYQARLSRPGLTMQGMVDDSMFDDALESNDKDCEMS